MSIFAMRKVVVNVQEHDIEYLEYYVGDGNFLLK